MGAGAYLLWKYVIKKDSGSSDETDTYVFKSACFRTTWHFDIYSEWQGSVGTVSLTPNQYGSPTEREQQLDGPGYVYAVHFRRRDADP